MKKLSNKGFTLVELIIVIAILAIIMLIAIPNFSGIQQRMQVRADKATAAQIGKAVRIWYTEYNSDPAFKGIVDNATSPKGKLPTAGTAMIELANLESVKDYVDDTLVPSSLRTETGTTDPNQKYYLGLVGSGTYEKVVVCIANTAPTAPAANTSTGATGVSSKTDVLYDGNINDGSDDEAKFKQALAYLEP